MSERKKIEERLRKKEQELQSLEEKLRVGRVYVQALRDVLKLISEDDGEDAAAESVLRSGSAVAQARDAILKASRPVHINDLLAAQGKDVSRESRASLTSSLAAYVRRGDIFTRTAPNTFGLVELGHEMADEDEGPEPSAGFGRVTPPRPPPPETSRDLDEDVPF